MFDSLKCIKLILFLLYLLFLSDKYHNIFHLNIVLLIQVYLIEHSNFVSIKQVTDQESRRRQLINFWPPSKTSEVKSKRN